MDKKHRVLFVLYLLALPQTTPASAKTYFIHPDHLGTPQMMTDAGGQVVWRADYDPFGRASVDEDPDGDGQTVTLNLRFPGQYYDRESGLHYNYFRDYDPGLGRYIQGDPAGLGGGLNPYAYVQNRPTRFSDPLGLVQWSGTIRSAGVSVLAGTSYYRISVDSECIHGRRGHAEIVAVGPTFGAQVKGTPPFSLTRQDIVLNDDLADINPAIFNGWFAQYNTGIALFKGYSCALTQVGGSGDILAKPINAGASSIGCGLQTGIEASLSATGGSATVVESGFESCSCADE